MGVESRNVWRRAPIGNTDLEFIFLILYLRIRSEASTLLALTMGKCLFHRLAGKTPSLRTQTLLH